jgi:plastocyanin
MARRSLFVLAAGMLGSLLLPAPAAVAGGGCHGGATTGRGDTVEMRDACFTPSTLWIDPGDTVTFVNQDPLTHNISATGWGNFDVMNQGDLFRATFSAPGIYPYACMYHPGMTGAIVVGDGTGAGNGDAVTVAADQPSSPSLDAALAAAEPQAPLATGSSGVGWVAGGAIGLGLGLAAGFAVRRRPRGSVERSG